MGLIERVTALLRANLNDLLDRAEEPEKTLKQLLLDMENQLLQVKTQLASALASQHFLETKQTTHAKSAGDWQRRAQLALGKNDDALARAALQHQLTEERLAANFAQEAATQQSEADLLRAAYRDLQAKLTETRAQADLLLTRHARARTAARAQAALQPPTPASALNRITTQIQQAEAQTQAHRELATPTTASTLATATSVGLEDHFRALEQSEAVETLLLELKNRQGRLLE